MLGMVVVTYRAFQVTTSVTNTGDVKGATAPQLYLALPKTPDNIITPPKVLRGFEKISLEAGESKEVTFELTRRDISYWDV